MVRGLADCEEMEEDVLGKTLPSKQRAGDSGAVRESVGTGVVRSEGDWEGERKQITGERFITPHAFLPSVHNCILYFHCPDVTFMIDRALKTNYLSISWDCFCDKVC